MKKDFPTIFYNYSKLFYSKMKIILSFPVIFRPLADKYLQLGRTRLHPPKEMKIPKYYYSVKKTRSNLPSISIVTPSYNQGSFLERTIQSVTEQEYPQLEYVVQDGGSKDESVQIIKNYQPKLRYWESLPDNGQSDAINRGFEHTSGEIMSYLNSDDLLLPGTLQYVGKYFASHPEVDVVYGHRILIDEKDQEIGRWILPPHDTRVLPWVDFIPQETLFWRRSLWEKVGGKIDENFKFAMDWDLLLRFREVNAVFARLPRFLGAFRIHEKQKTTANYEDIGQVEIKKLRRQYLGRDVSYEEVLKNIRKYVSKHIFCNFLYSKGIIRY